MSASIFSRRRSERFAQLIEAGGGRRQHARTHARSGLDDDLGELVSVSRRVRELPLTVQAHPEFREGLRAMLMATIDREGIGVTSMRPEVETMPSRQTGLLGSRRTRTRTAVIAGVAAGTLALSGMSAASGSAIPGDPLYGVKRSTERAQLALAGSAASRGSLNLEFARTRLDEAAAFRADLTRLTAVFDDMDTETRTAVHLLTTAAVTDRDGTALDAVDSFAASQRLGITTLRDSLAGAARTRADGSLALIDAVQRRSSALRGILPCGAAATGTTDVLGPVPTARCRVPGQSAPQGAGTPSKALPGTGANGAAASVSGQNAARPALTGGAGGTVSQPTVAPSASGSAGASAPPGQQPGLTDGGGLLDGVGSLLGDPLG
jgi:hypothetical protein